LRCLEKFADSNLDGADGSVVTIFPLDEDINMVRKSRCCAACLLPASQLKVNLPVRVQPAAVG
jgi:hypothetical protein